MSLRLSHAEKICYYLRPFWPNWPWKPLLAQQLLAKCIPERYICEVFCPLHNWPSSNEQKHTIPVDPAEFHFIEFTFLRIKVVILDLREGNSREKNPPTHEKSKPVLRLRRQLKENPEPTL